MVSKNEWRWAAIWAVVLVTVTVLPYAIAYLATPAGLSYTGFSTNPEDGHSYLAKMRQGWRGEWLYRLAGEPRRLVRRYAHDAWVFPQVVWRQWRTQRGAC